MTTIKDLKFDDKNFNNEEWRKVEGSSRHEVSNYGRVRKSTTKRLVHPGLNTYGYPHFSFKFGDKMKDLTVHRAVAIAFIPNPDNYSWEYIQKYVVGGGPTLLYEQISLFGIRAKTILAEARDFWFECKAKTQEFFRRKERELNQEFLRQEWIYWEELFNAFEDTRVGIKRFLRTSDRVYRERW